MAKLAVAGQVVGECLDFQVLSAGLRFVRPSRGLGSGIAPGGVTLTARSETLLETLTLSLPSISSSQQP